jgi:hypothetical protein
MVENFEGTINNVCRNCFDFFANLQSLLFGFLDNLGSQKPLNHQGAKIFPGVFALSPVPPVRAGVAVIA